MTRAPSPGASERRRGPVIAVVGPTASGKSSLAMELAARLGGEIVSADAMAVYRGMDVGTAKPSRADRALVPHHLIDVADPSEEFSVARFQPLAREAIGEVLGRGRIPIVVGGSGLYFHAVVDEFVFPPTDPVVRRRLEHEAVSAGPQALYARLEQVDPAAALRIQPMNARRIVRALEVLALTGRPFSTFRAAMDDPVSCYRLIALGLDPGGDVLRARIAERVGAMLAAGLAAEVRVLAGRPMSRTARQALGYKELLDALASGREPESAADDVVRRTYAYARRQLAWFRRDPRIRWRTLGDGGAALEWSLAVLSRDGVEVGARCSS